MAQAAFIGLGIMGGAMARNLVTRGVELVVYNRTRSRTEPLAALGAAVAETPRQAAAAAPVVFVMVTDDQALEAVTLGADGILSGIAEGGVIVDHSTVSPGLTRSLAARAAAQGVQWVDAPVTGGDQGAREATLTIMAGGEVAAFQRVRPLLGLMGRRILHVGPVGMGQTLKLVSNLVSGLTLMAAAEGLRLGLRAGLRLDAMEEVMMHGSARSYELEKLLGRLKAGDWTPGFSVDNRLKDLELAVGLAEALGQSIPLSRTAVAAYRAWRDTGAGGRDEASYVLAWDQLGHG
ncbi:6-phosphogluconate dehydrogenase [Candidatus Hydrogenisulfobacillus filiaventi]|uniref:6-phosphogluconate dehydrogenase n=1 Tax=Candidatus Hydrogenisulfobacillus filiaventi TaxID=2707344 RepID=A0A6F8ZJ89_9FIRM|nr:NAD(P)-dependent oxidoreductase [Bacillota bacterium]CAB1129795.1 6-phosphogluconate dehydrogenase [Candidatus Hydrogenisulfobacillus filiaventi]